MLPIGEIESSASKTAVKTNESTLGSIAASKSHYSIGDLTKEFKITARALRFYEEKDLISPQRIGLERIYSRRDRGRLQLIIMGKTVGFSLEDIKSMLDLYNVGDGGVTQLNVAQARFEAQISRLEEQRNAINSAITVLKEGAQEVERRLVSLSPAKERN